MRGGTESPTQNNPAKEPRHKKARHKKARHCKPRQKNPWHGQVPAKEPRHKKARQKSPGTEAPAQKGPAQKGPALQAPAKEPLARTSPGKRTPAQKGPAKESRHGSPGKRGTALSPGKRGTALSPRYIRSIRKNSGPWGRSFFCVPPQRRAELQRAGNQEKREQGVRRAGRTSSPQKAQAYRRHKKRPERLDSTPATVFRTAPDYFAGASAGFSAVAVESAGAGAS